MEIRKKQAAQRFNFRFTYNNYTEDGERELKLWLKEYCKYAVYGHEIAPTTGTPHLQGFFSLIKRQRITALQKQFQLKNIGLAILKADRSAEKNRIYCLKEDPTNFFEHGNITLCGAGARTDLTEITCKIKDGANIESVAMEYSEEWVKYKSGFRDLHAIVRKRKVTEERDITVCVYYGASGTGKTKRAVDECKQMGLGAPFICIHPNGDTLWFNNYDGEKGLVIDDFYGWIKPAELYRFLDKYKCQIPYKGGYTYAEWTNVWITSNNGPDDWYSQKTKTRLDPRALQRRLHNIEKYEIDMTDIDNLAAITRGDEYIKPDIFIEKTKKPLYLARLALEEIDYNTPPLVVAPVKKLVQDAIEDDQVSSHSMFDLDLSSAEEELAPLPPSPVICSSPDEPWIDLNK